MNIIKTLLLNIWEVLGQMSPYLLLGFLISGILSVFISPEWVEKHLGSGSGKFSSVLKATILGIPLPLCSCGVIPVSASLRKHGASKGATSAFLLSTPQTGLDSILASYGLLGPVFAIIRPLAALVTGFIGGILTTLLDHDDKTTETKQNIAVNQDASIGEKLIAALQYAFITLPAEIAKALMVGILIAAVVSTFFQKDFLSAYISSQYTTMLLMLLIGIPLYVCSTSSIPIALGFMKMGASPGAALVFLISGPATNAAAISVVWKLLGRKSAIIYLATVVIGAFGAGISLDALYSTLEGTNYANLLNAHHGNGYLETISAIIMLFVLALSQIYKPSSCCSSCSDCSGTSEHSDIKTPDVVLTINGMSCNHCSNAVKKAIEQEDFVVSVSVNLKTKEAFVFGQNLNIKSLINAVTSLGYETCEKEKKS